MTGILLAFVSAWSYGTSDYVGGRLSRLAPSTAVLLVAHATGAVLLVVVALAAGVAPPRDAATIAAGAALFELVGINALYRGLATEPSRIVAPAAALAPLVALVASLVTGDPPSLLTAATLVPILVGLVLAARAAPDEGDDVARSPRHGLLLGLVASAGFGMAFVFIDLALEAHADPSAPASILGVLLATRVTCALVLGANAFVRRQAPLPSSARLPATAAGLLIIVGEAGFAGAAALAPVGVAAAVASCHGLVTIALSARLAGERLTGAQQLGALLSVAGVAGVAATTG